MRGGKFLASGADTCVYSPAVACGSAADTIRKAPPKKSLVSRVTADTTEVGHQRAIIAILDRLQATQPDIYKYFNFADAVCTPQFKPSDEQERCRVKATHSNTAQNLRTPKQGSTLYASIARKSKSKTKIAHGLMELMLVMTYLNEEEGTHSDTHFNNLGWMGDQLVIFDWGRATTSLPAFVRRVEGFRSESPERQVYWKTFCQHVYQMKLIGTPGIPYFIMVCAWDTLGIAGALAHYKVVDAEVVKAFVESVIELVKTNGITGHQVSEKLRTMIRTVLFQHIKEPVAPREPANSPGLMQPAAAAAIALPAAPVAPPDPKARARERALEKKKTTCRQLLGIAGGGSTRKTRRHGRHGV